MGNLSSCRRGAIEPLVQEEPDIEERWARLVRGAFRLARLRRKWASIGHWLRKVSERGREE